MPFMYVNRMIIIEITINSFAIDELGTDIQITKIIETFCINILMMMMKIKKKMSFALNVIPD